MSNILRTLTVYRITWELDGHFRTFDVRAADMLDAQKKARKKLARVGLWYKLVVTITHIDGSIPF